MRYLGPNANKVLAYGVAAVSGTLLAVCSCTILPLFAGIYMMGAGLGPATAFLYSGPAISVLSIVLTANVLGLELGLARGIGAVVFSIVIGLCMHFIFHKEEKAKAAAIQEPDDSKSVRPLWQTALYFASMVGVLVFANWARPEADSGIWFVIWSSKWRIASAWAALLGLTLVLWFGAALWRVGVVAAAVALLSLAAGIVPAFVAGSLGLAWLAASQTGELRDWFEASWGFAKQISPLLLFGVLIAGLLLGRVGYEGLVPSEWVAKAVSGNSLGANAFASVAGAFMYFATLTEVPIIQGLMGAGMGKGPALTLLLAGPALSLPSILVITKVMGPKKTFVFVLLVIVFAMISGLLFGMIV
jgi:Predicted permeases